MQHRAYLMRLKEQKIEAYADAHAKEKIWPSVGEGLKAAGVTKMIIIQLGQDVILFEEAEDLDNAYRYLAQDAPSVEWDKMIGSWMELYPQTRPDTGQSAFVALPVVFYLESGQLRH